MIRPKEELPPSLRRRLWGLRIVVAAAAFGVIMIVVSMSGGDTGRARWLVVALVAGIAAEWAADIVVRHRLRSRTGA